MWLILNYVLMFFSSQYYLQEISFEAAWNTVNAFSEIVLALQLGETNETSDL